MKTARDILVEFGLELLNGGRDPSVIKMNREDIEELAERFFNRIPSSERALHISPLDRIARDWERKIQEAVDVLEVAGGH